LVAKAAADRMKQRQFKTGCKRCLGSIFAGVLTIAFGAVANAWTLSSYSNAVEVIPATAQPPTNQSPALDEKHLFALGMVETGNNDWEVGAAGEISRYQINPLIWKTYSPKGDYRDPVAATRVARQHWAWLAGYFVEKAGRQPNDFDMYVMWNTKFGYYAKRGFSPARLAPVVYDRAERFVNLVNRKG
jgi:hypothetical protein